MPFYLNGTPLLPSFHVTICSFFKMPLTIRLLYIGFPELPPTWISITMGMLEHVPFHYIFVVYLIWHHWDNPKWLPSSGSWTIVCVCICIKDIFGGACFSQAHKALSAHKSPAKLINRWASELRAACLWKICMKCSKRLWHAFLPSTEFNLRPINFREKGLAYHSYHTSTISLQPRFLLAICRRPGRSSHV